MGEYVIITATEIFARLVSYKSQPMMKICPCDINS
jgi:hypothetical protein